MQNSQYNTKASFGVKGIIALRVSSVLIDFAPGKLCGKKSKTITGIFTLAQKSITRRPIRISLLGKHMIISLY